MPRWWSRNCGALCPDASSSAVPAPACAPPGCAPWWMPPAWRWSAWSKWSPTSPESTANTANCWRPHPPASPTWPSSPIPRIFTCAWPASFTGRGFRWSTWWRPRPGPGARAASAKCAAPSAACSASFRLKRSFSPVTGCRPPISATRWPGWYAPRSRREEFFRKHRLAAERPLITVLPGSRRGESARHLPALLDAVQRIYREQAVNVVLPASVTTGARFLPSAWGARRFG